MKFPFNLVVERAFFPEVLFCFLVFLVLEVIVEFLSTGFVLLSFFLVIDIDRVEKSVLVIRCCTSPGRG